MSAADFQPYRVEADIYGDESVWFYRAPDDLLPVELLNARELKQSEGGIQFWKDIRDMIDARQDES